MNTTSESAGKLRGNLKAPSAYSQDGAAFSFYQDPGRTGTTQYPDWSSARGGLYTGDGPSGAGKDDKRVRFLTEGYGTLPTAASDGFKEPLYRASYERRPSPSRQLDAAPLTGIPRTAFEHPIEGRGRLVEPSHPKIVESESRGANYIDYRHYPPYEQPTGIYQPTSEYLHHIARYGNRPPESWVHGLSGSWRPPYHRDPLSEPKMEHHYAPPAERRRSHSPSSRRGEFVNLESRWIKEEQERIRRDYPEIEHHPKYYGPDYVNYRHALARHPSLINEVDFKTCYHKLNEDSGNLE
jgi:hypothetical protein